VQRYWDGESWTGYVAGQGGGAPFTDHLQPGESYPPPGIPHAPPVQGQSTAVAVVPEIVEAAPPQTAPHQVIVHVVQPPRKRRWPWVLLGLFVLFGGCTAIVSSAFKHAVDQLNAEQRQHAITQAQFDSVSIGTSKDDVVNQLGKQPEDAQQFVSKGVFNEGDVKSSCIYYNQVGQSFGSRYQFCFDNNDDLDSKNAY
jgi:hypothetical protein